MKTRTNRTTLGEFGRKVRDEPLRYIFRHKLWVQESTVPAEEVLAWLKSRYTESKAGHRFMVSTYPHQDGNRYVHFILMETFSDTDQVWMELRGWHVSDKEVHRGQRIVKRKLKPAQRKELNDLLARTAQEYYDRCFAGTA